jgi:hypothetical protein
MAEKPSRNDPCSCGSGKKYKKCCGMPKKLAERKLSVIKSSSKSSLLGRISAGGAVMGSSSEESIPLKDRTSKTDF